MTGLLRRALLGLMLASSLPAWLAHQARAFDGPELYPGERPLAEAARNEGLLIAGNIIPNLNKWDGVIEAFNRRYPGITIVYNDIGSSAVVSTLDANRDRPTLDTAYYFGLSAVDAAGRGLLTSFKPVGADKLAVPLRDPQGLWTAIHTFPVAFLVNRKLVKNPPKSWADLKKPEYRGMIVYQDPTVTAEGLITVLAANAGLRGTLDSVRPALDYFAELHKSGAIRAMVTDPPYVPLLRGQVAIWLAFESVGARARHIDGMEDIEIVLPSEGTAAASYAVSLVKGARDENAGKLWMNFLLGETAQRLFAEAYARPVMPGIAPAPGSGMQSQPQGKIEQLDMVRVWQRKQDIDRAWAGIAGTKP
jgi:putative spermidine/putrescine transport system substrate-binding protein